MQGLEAELVRQTPGWSFILFLAVLLNSLCLIYKIVVTMSLNPGF